MPALLLGAWKMAASRRPVGRGVPAGPVPGRVGSLSAVPGLEPLPVDLPRRLELLKGQGPGRVSAARVAWRRR